MLMALGKFKPHLVHNSKVLSFRRVFENYGKIGSSGPKVISVPLCDVKKADLRPI